VKVEDNNALHFILQDEIYLLDEDRIQYSAPTVSKPITETTPAISAPVIETPAPAFNYLGSNKKSFLVLVNYTDQEFIKDDHLTALESVLGRLGHSREDIAILNLVKHDWADHKAIVEYFSPKTMVMLGQKALPSGISNLKFNQVEKIDSISILHTFSFDEMMTNVDNKKAFWEQMKNL
jgi:hypothetical protein